MSGIESRSILHRGNTRLRWLWREERSGSGGGSVVTVVLRPELTVFEKCLEVWPVFPIGVFFTAAFVIVVVASVFGPPRGESPGATSPAVALMFAAIVCFVILACGGGAAAMWLTRAMDEVRTQAAHAPRLLVRRGSVVELPFYGVTANAKDITVVERRAAPTLPSDMPVAVSSVISGLAAARVVEVRITPTGGARGGEGERSYAIGWFRHDSWRRATLFGDAARRVIAGQS